MNKKYGAELSALTVFRGILDDPVMARLKKLLDTDSKTTDFISLYSDFVSELFKTTDNFTEYLLSLVLENENPYMLKMAEEGASGEILRRCAEKELLILQELSRLTSADVCDGLDYDGYLSEWAVSERDFSEIYNERIKNVSVKGYGIYAKYHTFMLRDEKIVPVKNPDTQRLSQLSGYESERKKVIDNTIALLNGKPAANVLLYGDAGTGKSSTVKAVVNEFKDDGLRLIEMKKSQLHEMPLVIEKIAKNPLKFIIFIDDLSFSSDDDDFGALKAVLEGSASSKTSNIVIYATSNRRHLVKEKYSDREGDDMHARDSMEELTSLSERFGLKVTFTKPNKDLYLRIVENLADSYGLECDKDELFSKAEAYALRRSGRSGRAARQFVEMMLSGQL
ncbi:MAG: DUF815 domain-containing protein [Oscillospiraceae bacterium]|nr:DUF815 domain-containing protein [Oscillospiraceae bacterium]